MNMNEFVSEGESAVDELCQRHNSTTASSPKTEYEMSLSGHKSVSLLLL